MIRSTLQVASRPYVRAAERGGRAYGMKSPTSQGMAPAVRPLCAGNAEHWELRAILSAAPAAVHWVLFGDNYFCRSCCLTRECYLGSCNLGSIQGSFLAGTSASSRLPWRSGPGKTSRSRGVQSTNLALPEATGMLHREAHEQLLGGAIGLGL